MSAPFGWLVLLAPLCAFPEGLTFSLPFPSRFAAGPPRGALGAFRFLLENPRPNLTTCHFHWCDSGELSAVLALGIVAEAKRQGKTFSALLAPITGRYCASGEVNIRGVDDRPAAVARVEAAVTRLLGAPERRIDFDGVRLDWADAWFGVRPSNTEPILRLAGEARTPAQLEAMLVAAKAAI